MSRRASVTPRGSGCVRLGTFRDPLSKIGPEKEQPLRDYDVAKTWHPKGLTVALLTRQPA